MADSEDKRTSREMFLALPVDWPTYCSRVDIESGLWAFCKLCNKRVPTKDGRPFTIGSWNSHRKDVATTHNKKLADQKLQNTEDLRRRGMAGTLTEKEKSRLKQDSKKQQSLSTIFKKKSASDAAIGVPVGKGVLESSTNTVTVPKRNNTSAIIAVPTVRTCEGILQDSRGSIQDKISAYWRYASMMETNYVGGLVGTGTITFAQLFDKTCDGIGVKKSKKINLPDFQEIWQCAQCANHK
jgi:hypothetical protein